MENKVKEEPTSPTSPKKKQKRAESPKSPPPSQSKEQASNSSTKCPESALAALAKARRLLYTLIQHAEDSGNPNVERIKQLIVALVGGTMTLDDFQNSLHEITGSPLRPFVLPYLQVYLPMLQHDCASQARGRKQSILEYLSSTEQSHFERVNSPVSEIYATKRKNIERDFENESVKRQLLSHQITSEQSQNSEEQWRNIHVMLNCTLSMVEKTKQALTLLQQSGTNWNNILEEDRLTRITEERIQQIRKKAEDAISDIKKKATQEMERAVSTLRLHRPRPSFPEFF